MPQMRVQRDGVRENLELADGARQGGPTMADETRVAGADIDAGRRRGCRKVSQVANRRRSVMRIRIMRVGTWMKLDVW